MPSPESRAWSIRFAVEGDVRFLSHLDVLRAIERIAARAGLPLRYSRGFNPRPKISVPHPRPVGVATRRDLLVLSLDRDLDPQVLLEGMNQHAPGGMTFFEAERLEAGKTPRVWKTRYELRVRAGRAADVKDRLGRLRQLDSWPVERLTRAGGRRTQWKPKRIDIKPLVDTVEIEGDVLRMALVRGDDLWARPGEVLRLLRLEEDLAALVRTMVEYET